MKDPGFSKLKNHTSFMLNELILVITHRPEQKEWRHPRENPPPPVMAMLKPGLPPQNGLGYFHLN